MFHQLFTPVWSSTGETGGIGEFSSNFESFFFSPEGVVEVLLPPLSLTF